jgi:hypothetical protein
VSVKTRMPYSTVKKHARMMGYEAGPRPGKPEAAVATEVKTNYSGLPRLHEVLARGSELVKNDRPKA